MQGCQNFALINSTFSIHSQGQTFVEQEQAAKAVQEGDAPMTGREDRGRVAKAEPFSSSTCMRLSILVLCTTSSGISAPSICLSAILSSAPKAALVKASSLQGYFLKSCKGCKRLKARNECYLSRRTLGSARARTHHQPTSYMHPFHQDAGQLSHTAMYRSGPTHVSDIHKADNVLVLGIGCEGGWISAFGCCHHRCRQDLPRRKRLHRMFYACSAAGPRLQHQAKAPADKQDGL